MTFEMNFNFINSPTILHSIANLNVHFHSHNLYVYVLFVSHFSLGYKHSEDLPPPTIRSRILDYLTIHMHVLHHRNG